MDPDELHLLIDSLSEGVYVVDAQWRITAFNQAAETYFSRPRQGVIGRPYAEAFPEARGTEVEQAIGRILAGEAEQRFQFVSTAARGRVAQVTVRRTGRGDALVVFSDRTEDLAAREEARESRAILRHVADAIPVLISYLDRDQRFVFANRTYEEWFGTKVADMIGRPAREVLGEPFYELRRPYIERALRGESVSYEVPFARDYSRRTLVQHFPHHDADGSILGMYTLVQDLTPLRRAEDALAAADARLRLAIQAAALGVWEWVVGTEEMILSRRARAIWGLPPEGPVSRQDLRKATHPEDREAVLAQVARAVDPRTRENAPMEYRIIRPDGEVRWVRSQGEAVFTDTGATSPPSRYVGMVEDVTERKEAEERLRLLAREVDHRANNLLTIVQGAIALTRGSDVAEYKDSLLGRVSALARAHQLLASSRWTGADLRRILEDEVRPYVMDDGGRVRLDGDHLELKPQVAQSLAMAIHELTTNAVKYGALSSRAGRITASWAAEDGRCRFLWRESDGPAVSPPTRRGVGMHVLDRSITTALQGGARLDWRPQGLVCELEFPLG